MPSERVQRRIDRLLDDIEQAADQHDWNKVLELVAGVLEADPENADALTFKRMAEASLSQGGQQPSASSQASSAEPVESHSQDDEPQSFASGRYTVSKFLGEGGKKKVYLAHDNTLDRDVAFALIKTEGLDETSRERVRREAQAMGRMGTHPSIMPIYDLGEENGQPYMVQPLMSGGDVEGLVDDAEGPLALEDALRIATQTARGLSFAHSKGIVHRDLKPGNVWLDEDGAAKIGDFGLAVATDRSRLTVEKVMIGTVSYMPPEQATGGEVTPRADLYSLGAMLYEMCTGRVPFMGDDDIGIISQHINTPPVAPSWHNNQIPKTLDSLILRLLAKDPAERPSDADEVLAALSAVDLSAVEESGERQASLDSMAGGVFVGRHREMDQLKAIFEDVLSGKGRMVTLVGEPGIGKTRTAQELATYAGMRGANVLWGRSYESGGAPPYWPWVQVIRSHVAATEPQELRNQLGATAPVIAEVVSDVKTKLPDIAAPTSIEDPESARFRLFDSISTFLKNTASSTPLVLMLEDLHWSDKPSLTLLEFIARELANSRILIVGNYRDMELNRRHPLSVTLGDLTRERLFERVVLRGLQKHDVQRFIEIAAGIAPPAALVDTVHSQTEGNPLFVTETVRLLIQEGDIASGQSSKGGTTSWEIRIPEGVREVIGRRLDRLSERCNEVLTIAAVIGRQFRFPVLLELSDDVTEDMLLDVMDEALAARVIEELPSEVGYYEFTHTLIQETLTQELSLTRRVRLHAKIAKVLEAHYGEEATAHAPELAYHFENSEEISGPSPFIKYSLLANRELKNRFANNEAATGLVDILSRFEGIISDDAAVATRLLSEIRCQQAYGNEQKESEAALLTESAFNYYIAKEQYNVAAEMVINARTGIFNTHVFLAMSNEIIDVLDKKNSLFAQLLISRGSLIGLVRDADEGLEILESAMDMALIEEQTELLPTIHRRKAQIYFLNNRWEECLASSDIGLRTIRASLEDTVTCAFWATHACVTLGRLNEAKLYAKRAFETGETSDLPSSRFHGRFAFEIVAVNTANVSMINQLIELPRNIYTQNIIDRILDSSSTQIIRALLFGSTQTLQDIFKSLLAFFNENADGNNLDRDLVFQLMLAICYVTKKPDYVSPLIDALDKTDAYYVIGTSPTQQRTELFNRSMIAYLSNDISAFEKLKPKLSRCIGTFDSGFWGSLPASANQMLGDLFATNGQHEEAVNQYQTAIDQSDKGGYKLLMSLVRILMSETLLDRNGPGDREKAIELQDEAISIATELGMKPLLERVLAKREILRA